MSNGKVYLVPTPIGNLKDITLRALEVLKSVDIIAAEDTRQTLKLLNHFEIKKQLISYHQHNEQGKSEDILSLIEGGKEVAIVTDAGTPGISDPGAVIVSKCIEKGYDFEVLPGATAITTALVYSGLDTTKFLFRGFISRENKKRKKLFDEVRNATETLIFYESPHRLLNTLSTLRKELGNRRISACRELTKLHEEITRGTIDEVIEFFSEKGVKGEFVLVVEGKTQDEIEQEIKSKWESLSVEEHIVMYIEEGLSKKEAIKKVAKERGMQKNDVYKIATNI
ncbi:16S rRNA (cytidine1402-2'-O)-methyltransferase [Clostridium sp. DSM 8431]|uniref:16S rRNA (cytidine(1402)-2'-O)-methyltransferase n=1 Tax=Clostridium sp. DSM 8431 TaxID=1761781 RepID=UPI0008EF1C73|nr:16S rRNA (cytidine(1402)-2'-O)-methyltransferase [Clostridium sp. DSM 8431]SFU80966.1 16S rRNA (cytidine1402-2'-O)-methyltransferase [Clostridium sp. DSM 8431]